MRHRLAVLTAVLALASLAACSDDKDDKPAPQAGALPGASADLDVPPGASGTAPADSKPGAPAVDDKGLGRARTTLPAGVFSASGVGPYAIGSDQAKLASAGLLGKVAKDANGCAVSTGVGKYSSPGLVFFQGRLEHIKVSTAKSATDKGVKVGSTFVEVKSAYPGGKALADWNGATAWYAVDGDSALLMKIKSNKVTTIEAGTAATLQFTYTDNQGC